jgi:tRNA(fMet)-specific endonuclease VapC
MTVYTLDTNIVRPILRNDQAVLGKIAEALREGHLVKLNALTYFETKRGLLAADATRQLQRFDRLCEELGILMLTRPALDRASAIYADLRRQGTLIEDADLLIAAIALANDSCLVTHNTAHFERVPGLQLEDWLSSGT